MKNVYMKKTLAFLLALIMCLSMLPMSAFAEETEDVTEPTETEEQLPEEQTEETQEVEPTIEEETEPVYVPVESITITAEKTELEVGETLQLFATVIPEDATNKEVIWSSSDESVLTVDERGLITALSEGTAEVTTMPNDETPAFASIVITVTDNASDSMPDEQLIGASTDTATISLSGGNILTSENFPDANFLSKLQSLYPNGLTANQAAAVVSLSVLSLNISSLQGIEFFTGLIALDCHNNKLSSLDVSDCTQLTRLYCGDNSLSGIDLSGCTQLTSLSCGNNSLSSLDVSNCTQLTYLSCSNNSLSSLDVSNCTQLTSLSCGSNNISSLDVSNCTQLTSLECYSNEISSLDVSSCTQLTSLQCFNNSLSSLDVSNCTQLTYLSCSNNSLSGIDLSGCAQLTSLSCHNNSLSSLDVSSCAQLTSLSCGSNNISSLDVSNCTQLTSLSCGSNNISSLDVSNCTQLTSLQCYSNEISSLDVSSCTQLTSLQCYNNSLSGLVVSNCKQLKSLFCGSNNISSLNVSNCTQLTSLSCGSNNISSLDVSNCTQLTSLFCTDNNLSTINLIKNKNLSSIYCTYQRIWVVLPSDNAIDMKSVVGVSNINRVTNAKYGTYDSTSGCLKVNSGVEYVEYDYSTDDPYDTKMTVKVYLDRTANNILTSSNFPDLNFLLDLKSVFPYGMTAGDAAALKKLHIPSYADDSKNVASLKGIEFFTGLTYLCCTHSKLSSLDVSNNTQLEELRCSNNNLTSLNIRKNINLKYLYCENSNLTSLDVSNNTQLSSLNCNNNSLKSLDVSGCTLLSYLRCSNNNLTSLDVSNNTQLSSLNCNNNSLKSLDVSGCTLLSYLYCNNNNLSSLDISDCTQFFALYCNNNALSKLTLRYDTYINGCSLSPQNISAELVYGDVINMNSIVGSDNVSNVTNVSGGTYDAKTGMLTVFPDVEKVEYKYLTSSPKYSVMDVTVEINRIIPEGNCGDNLKWLLTEDRVLHISGTGAMTNYSSDSSVPWDKYRSDITAIEISEGVTSIGSHAFNNCSKVTEIRFPESITEIGDYATTNCNALRIFVFKGSAPTVSGLNGGYLTLIAYPEAYANEYSTILYVLNPPLKIAYGGNLTDCGLCGTTHIWVLDSTGKLTTSGNMMDDYSPDNPAPWYKYRDSIISIKAIGNIGDYAFFDLDNVVDISESTLKDSSTGSYCFADCDSLKSVTIPEYGFAGEYYFCGCDALESVTFVNQKTIQRGVFKDCISLNNLKFINCSATDIKPYAFYNCSSLEYSMCGGCTNIGEYAFYNSAIKKVHLNAPYISGSGYGTVYLADNAFAGLPEGSVIEYHGHNVATGYSLKINEKAYDHDKTTLYYFNSDINIGTSVSWKLRDDGTLIISGSGKMKDSEYNFQFSSFWYRYSGIKKVIIEDGVESVGAYAFFSLPISEVQLPNSVNTLGNKCFGNCTNLSSINIPSLMLCPGEGPFSGCSKLKTLGPDNTYNIYYQPSVFGCVYQNMGLEKVVLSSSTTKIGMGNIKDCASTVEFIFLGKVPDMYSSTFATGRSFINLYYLADCNPQLSPGVTTEYGSAIRLVEMCHFDDDKNVVTEHTPKEVPGAAPTCTKDGITDGAYCDVCGKVLVAQQVVPAIGHNTKHYNRKKPSCTETGIAEYWKCESCKKIFSDSECAFEVTSEDLIIPALNHDLIHYDVKAPTCIEIGWNAYDACSRCDYSTYVELPALGHRFINYESDNDAKCEEDGHKTAKCERCDATDTIQDTGTAMGHRFGEAVFTWSTDCKSAVAKCICENDENHVLSGDATVSSVEKISPSCEEMGITTYTAVITLDGKQYTDTRDTEDVPALGHELVHHDAKEPTFTEVGWKEYDTCTRCDYTTYEEIPVKGWVLTYVLADDRADNSDNPNGYESAHEDITLASPTLNGYSFNGWYLNENCTIRAVEPQIRAEDTGAKTFYAKWTMNTYSIKFSSNGGTGSMATLTKKTDKSGEIAVSNKLKRTGYKFTEWNTAADGSGESFGSTLTIYELAPYAGAKNTITLYAQWQPISYTVEFDANGGDGVMEPVTLKYGESWTVAENTFDRTGYTPNAWKCGSKAYRNGQSVKNLSSQDGATVTMTAQWKVETTYRGYNYKITFNGNGNTGGKTNAEAMKVGTAKALTSNGFTKTGYHFIGWATTEEGDVAYTNKQSVQDLNIILNPEPDRLILEAVELYAVWEKNTYKVTFNGNGGKFGKATSYTQTLTYDTEAALDANGFERAGYSFKQWNTKADGKGAAYADRAEVMNLSSANNGKVSLYAIWKYSVTLNPGTGEGEAAEYELTYGQSETVNPDSFSRKGYCIAGWNTDAAKAAKGTVQYKANAVKNIKPGTTLYAVWKPITYKVVFHNNIDGVADKTKTQTLTYDKETALTANSFTWKGHTFQGWRTEDSIKTYTNKEKVINLAEVQGAEVHLYAIWN